MMSDDYSTESGQQKHFAANTDDVVIPTLQEEADATELHFPKPLIDLGSRSRRLPALCKIS